MFKLNSREEILIEAEKEGDLINKNMKIYIDSQIAVKLI